MAYSIFTAAETEKFYNSNPDVGVINRTGNTTGHKIVLNNITYSISYDQGSGMWSIYEHPNGTYDRQTKILQRIHQAYTTYCCGVWQLGSFYCPFDAPQELEDLMIKMIASCARYKFAKGVMQAYFYRSRSKSSSYQHDRILKAFIRNGFVDNSPETFNPNSGNMIKGLVRPCQPPKEKRATRAMLQQRLDNILGVIHGNT